MTQRTIRWITPLLGLALCAAARVAEATPAAAAGDVAVVKGALAIVPSDALAFFMLKNLAELDAKLLKLTTTLGTPSLSFRDLVKGDPGVEKGLDANGTMLVIMLPGAPGREPKVALALPTADYKQIAESLGLARGDGSIEEYKLPKGMLMLAAHRGDFALFSPAGDRSALERVLYAKASVADELAGFEPWLAGNDLSVAFTRTGIRLAATELRKANERFFPHGLPPGKAEVPSVLNGSGDPLTMLMAIRSYGKVLDAVEKELTAAAIGVSADRQGTLRLRGRLRLAEGGRLAEILGQVQPPQRDLLAGLPAGEFVFAGAGAMPEPLAQGLAKLGAAFMEGNFSLYGLSPADARRYAAVVMQAQSYPHGMSVVMAAAGRDEPIFGNLFELLRVRSASQTIEQYQKQFEAANQILKGAKSDVLKPSELKKLQIGDRPALEVQVSVPLPKLGEENPAAQARREAIWHMVFGPTEKMTMHLAAANETTVVVGVNMTLARMLKAIEGVNSGTAGLAGDENVAATAALLPGGAQWIGYASPRGCVGLIERFAREALGGLPLGLPPLLSPFPQTPPVGLALRARGGALEGTVVVPASVLKAAGEYAAALRESMSRNPQLPPGPE